MTLSRPALLSFIASLLLAPATPAQRIVPPPPPEYAVQFRYRIRVGGNERVVQYREMMRHLAAAGFRRTDTPESNEAVDPKADRMSGVIAANRVGDLLGEPHVKSILLMPNGYKLPDNPEQRVLVQIKLVETSSLSQQRALFYQALDKLRRMGLVDKVGYDQEDYSRILGSIPAGDVEDLLVDLRLQPLGWLTPQTPVESLPDPIRGIDPIRGVEVLPDPEGVPPSAERPVPNVPAVVEGAVNVQAKIAPDLRAAAAAENMGTVRFEVVLTRSPALDDTSWRAIFGPMTNVVVEGRIGPVVTLLAPASAIATLAASPDVATVRPPRMATIQPAASSVVAGPAALADSGLDRLHKLGFKGTGVRVAVIDADFTGVGQHVGRELPKNTTVIDLTAARNPSILPEPLAPGAEPGRGTRLALAVRVAAPEADVVLVRVDPAAMYQLLTVARFIHGDAFRPENLANRNRELLAENNALRVDRAKLNADRLAAQNNFSEGETAVQQRRDVEVRSAALARREQEFNDRLNRFYDIEAGLADLRRADVVVCPLAWDEGYPFDGSDPLARYLDDIYYGRPRRKPVGPLTVAQRTAIWFQAAGNTRGQAWNGPLIDNDGNGAFEFAPPDTRPPQGLWTTEINFLHWLTANGQRSFDLPAGAKVRLTFQWTEAHDPSVSDIPGPDLYRVPLADLRLLVLRQRDPSGMKVSNDDFNVIAQTEPLPQLIERHRSWATYEHVVEFAVDTPGRIAVRLEGTVPPTIRPPTVASLPIQDRSWSPHGRLFVNMSGATGGQLVIGDYQPGLGGLGAPGNGLYPRTTGAADAQGREQPYSAKGPPSGQQLLAKPRWLAFDELPGVQGGGTEQATAFAGGLYASVMSAGTIESQKLNWLQVPRGTVMRVPPVWLDQLERRWPKTGRE
jgi:hypothetical protein